MFKQAGLLLLILIFSLSFKVQAKNQYIESLDLSVGVSHVCSITKVGIKCFGNVEDTTLRAPTNLKSVDQISSGNRFSCVKVKEGIRCWGQIPGQSKTDILIGQSVLKKPKLLAVGYEHACGVSIDNKIKCWGRNDFGESTPPSKLKNITEISLGMSNGCAIADGKISCWGLKNTGSIDVPENIINPRNLTSGWWHHCVQSDEGIKCWGYPFKDFVVPDDQNIKDFTSGGFYNCAIVDSFVKCWDETGKTSVVEDSAGATKLSVGATFACAITSEKGVICWKLSSSGIYKRLKSFVPAGGISNIEFVAAGNASTCVYGDEDQIKCWGHNPDGALDVPATLPGPLSEFTLGSHKLCAIKNAELSCFGDTNTDYNIPRNLGNVTMVSSGGYQICAGTNEKIACWGDDVRDALILPKNLSNVKEISSGFTHACAQANNTVTCWGGTGLIKGVNPAKKLKNSKAICAGGTFSCAIDSRGNVSCWGQQIPFAKDLESEMESFNKILLVPKDIKGAVEISCGLTHACAIYGGKIKCWGNGQFSGKKLAPQAGIKNPHMLTAGWNHTCALGDQGLYCWGDMLNLNMPNYSLEK